MITASQLRDIVAAFNGETETIPIKGDIMEKVAVGQYRLHRDGQEYHVKGIGWGHGHLFVVTEEKGTTGISYPHEIDTDDCDYEDEDGIVYDDPVPRYHQITLEDFA